MKFSSLTHLGYFIVALILYSFVPRNFRAAFLAACGLAFYFSLSPLLAALLVALTVFTFYSGILIERSSEGRRRISLYLSLSVNFGTLVYFKYSTFITESLATLFHFPTPLNSQSLGETIGLSFIVFQVTSYLMDVYFHTTKAEKSFLDFSLLVAFFPKLLQGPLERAADFLPQTKKLERLQFENLKNGFLLIAWGLFLKLVVADRLADVYVDPVYIDPVRTNGFDTLLAFLIYPLQLYFDFSGYTTAAIGVGHCFGVRLSENFNSPFLAESCADFWRRWHMTLSKWLQDYLFLPLQMGFRNFGIHGSAVALMITFTVAGVWHGATWGFVVFGIIQGIWLSTELYLGSVLKKNKRIRAFLGAPRLRPLRILRTYLLLSLSFVFFRAANLNQASNIFKSVFYTASVLASDLSRGIAALGASIIKKQDGYIGSFNFTIIVASLILIFTVSRLKKRGFNIGELNSYSHWALTEALLFFVFMFGVFSGAGFAYFKF